MSAPGVAPRSAAALLQCNTKFAVIAVQNYAGSGSLFLQSLLDGHPQALFLPATYGTPSIASPSFEDSYSLLNRASSTRFVELMKG